MSLSQDEIERLAKDFYAACPSVKPVWEQLGDVTRSVWRERALEQEKRRLEQILERREAIPDGYQNPLF